MRSFVKHIQRVLVVKMILFTGVRVDEDVKRVERKQTVIGVEKEVEM